MLKRLGISLCLLLAFALLQAHNFLPHHHHEVISQKHHHHSHDAKDHHHNDEEGDQGPEQHFPDLDHSAELGKVLLKPQVVKEIIENPVIELSNIIWLSDKFSATDNPPDYHPPDNDSPLHTIFLSHSLPLRAPPVSSLT